MPKVLVTGGAGFIGSHLCRRLLLEGWEVASLDNFNDFYDPTVKQANIAQTVRWARGLDREDDFASIRADICDDIALGRAFEEHKPSLVVHLAAMAGVRPSIENPALYARVNLMGTMNLLDCMATTGCKRLVFASSSSVYGNNEKVPFSEDDPVDRPISPYAATKKAGELLCHTHHSLYGIGVACLRFFTVYGPGQRPDLAIHKFTKLMREGKPIPLYGDGSTMRDYTFISDIVDGVVASINWLETSGGYDIFNLGNDAPVSLLEMVHTLEEALGVKATIEWLPMQPGDVQRTCADTRKAGRMLGYAPAVGFAQGIRQYIDSL